MSPAVLAATTLGLGRWPWAPATFTSLVVSLAVYALGRPGPLPLLVAGGLLALVGIPVASSAERELGHDARPITLDETAGMLLTLAAAPPTAAGYGVAFLLFRGFDVLKPPPVHALQGLPRGAGVVADDVGAAIYSALVLLLLRALGLRLPWLSGAT